MEEEGGENEFILNDPSSMNCLCSWLDDPVSDWFCEIR